MKTYMDDLLSDHNSVYDRIIEGADTPREADNGGAQIPSKELVKSSGTTSDSYPGCSKEDQCSNV